MGYLIQDQTLRTVLRQATHEVHDALDSGIGALDLAEEGQYALFLRTQLAARLPVEAWCADHCPPALLPPRTTHLIEADLRDLGHGGLVDHATFAPAADVEPVGVAWVLAGSSMGNRAMLSQLRKRAPAGWPVAFLSDDAMSAFFKSLLPLIERPALEGRAAAAIAGARAVFDAFLSVAPGANGRRAAA